MGTAEIDIFGLQLDQMVQVTVRLEDKENRNHKLPPDDIGV